MNHDDFGNFLYCCQVCRKKLLKSNGFSCFSCCFPAVRLCKWLKESVHQNRKAEFVLTLDGRYATWIALGYYFSSSFQKFETFEDSKLPQDATNAFKAMDFYMAPYVVDSSFENLVSRTLNTPSSLRAWAITIKAERPVSFFLDLEAQESKWPKLLFSKNPGHADFQMFTTLKWVADFIHEKFDVVSKIKRRHWWIFSCDREEGSNTDYSKTKQSFQPLGLKRSRRCYLPSLEFNCIGNLQRLMQEMKHRILKVIQGPESAEKAKVSVFAGFKNGEFLSYIDFGVYHGERQMRLPLCVKRHPDRQNPKKKGKENSFHPLSLFQVGETEWCEELFFKNKKMIFSASRKKEVRDFLLFVQSTTSKEKQSDKTMAKNCPAFVQIAAGMIYYGKGGIRNQKPDNFLTFELEHEEENKISTFSPSVRHQNFCSTLYSLPPNNNNTESNNKEQDQKLFLKARRKRKRSIPTSFSLIEEIKNKNKDKKEQTELFYSKFPSQLLEVALAWLRSEGSDSCSSVTPTRNAKGQTFLSIRAPQTRARTCYFLASHFELEKQKRKRKKQNQAQMEKERWNQSHRNNGAFFTIHFGNHNFNFEGPSRTVVTKGYFHYRCLSQSCAGKKSPKIPWILPYCWNLQPKTAILIS